ncbi:hypothetical protein U8P80_35020 (plasmid) [Rhizobium beringeri]|uniref:hypothetical protein n=1 Tax=Rhizobium leguminosarum TaxID=384 RepID=UPI0012F71E6E|nr:hypothetical protein [Rhizobium leguminosarum]WSG78386.1 hypothetical protein U8P80_35020 [Rhizobium beringeri]WSH18581.1 hypothetical protein U8P74_35020 [Rhizobium beringeri]
MSKAFRYGTNYEIGTSLKMERAVSEPMRRVIDHHNSFNRRVKLLFGSLNKVMDDGLKDNVPTSLPYGQEPWGEPKIWSSAADGHAAAELLGELGVVRAASAFEDFLQGVISEIDRSQLSTTPSTPSDLIERVLSRLSMEQSARPSLPAVRFFDCARNCIVHQMGRANSELVTLSGTKELHDGLAASSARKRAKWKPVLPQISLGEPIVWKPRHAILASESYYRVAIAINVGLVDFLGRAHFVAMAAHWALAVPVPCVAVRRSLISTIRTALNNRYRVNIDAQEIAPLLKSIDRWEHIKALFQQNYPNHLLT